MSKQVIVKGYKEEIKCGGCNWKTTALFGFEGDDLDEIGLCDHCFAELLANNDYRVKMPDNKDFE